MNTQNLQIIHAKIIKLCRKYKLKEPDMPGSVDSAKALLVQLEEEVSEKEAANHAETSQTQDDKRNLKPRNENKEACDACGGVCGSRAHYCDDCRKKVVTGLDVLIKDKGSLDKALPFWNKENPKLSISHNTYYSWKRKLGYKLERIARKGLTKKQKTFALEKLKEYERHSSLTLAQAARNTAQLLKREFGIDYHIKTLQNMFNRKVGRWRDSARKIQNMPAPKQAKSEEPILTVYKVCKYIEKLVEVADLDRVREALESAELRVMQAAKAEADELETQLIERMQLVEMLQRRNPSAQPEESTNGGTAHTNK